MFGGFDGNFYNDMHILHLADIENKEIVIEPSTLSEDYCSMIGSEEDYDIIF